MNMFVGKNAHVAIGTDSPASNTDMSMMHELKTIAAYFPGIDLSVLLRWATLNGAEALMLDDKLGDFKPGKKPGVVLISGIDFAKMRLTAESTAKRLDEPTIGFNQL